MRPGAIVLTVMPNGPSSDDSVLDQLTRAALADAAALSLGETSAPEILTIRPQFRVFIPGEIRSVSRRAARKLSVIASSQKASSASPATGLAPPALLTRISIRPPRAADASAAI